MGAVFRWVRDLYRFFAAPTRRLVVYPLGAVPVTTPVGVAIGAAWGAAYSVVGTVGNQSIRIYGIDLTNPTAAIDYEVNIGYGPIGAEVWIGVVTYNLAGVPLPFPMEVPANQRILARCRATVAGNTVDVKALAYTI